MTEFTPRQRAVIELVSRGLSNKAVARRLEISENGVRNHLHLIFKQLGLRNRTELALWASRYIGEYDHDRYDR